MLNRQFSIIQKVFFVIIYLAVLLLQPTALKLARLFLLRLLYFLHLRRMNFYLYNIICQMSLYKDLINYDLCRFFCCLCAVSRRCTAHLRPSQKQMRIKVSSKERKFDINWKNTWNAQKNSVTSPWQFNGVKNFSYFCHVLIALCCLSSFFFLLFFSYAADFILYADELEIEKYFQHFFISFFSVLNYSNRQTHFSVQLNKEIPRSTIAMNADQLWTLPSCVWFYVFLWLNFILIFQFSFSLLTFYGFYVRYFE